MFEPKRFGVYSAELYRNGQKVMDTTIEIAPLDIKNTNYTYMNGVTVDLTAYMPKESGVQIFDSVYFDEKKYEIREVKEFNTFYYVIGQEIKHEDNH